MFFQRVDLRINSVIVIQSLPDNDKQTGRELYDDTIKRLCQKNKFNSGIVNIKSKQQFMMLSDILIEKHQLNQLRPFLHFEIHGEENGLGLVLANGELVTWAEVGSITRAFNAVLKNELFISLATCKGAFILKSINNPCIIAPFWGIVGPKNEIYLDDVVNDFTAFYSEFLTTFDLQKAIDALNNSNISAPYIVMTAEFIFDEFIEKYFENTPLNKEDKFKELAPKMERLYPNLTMIERDNLLKQGIDTLDRKALISECKKSFLMK